MPIIEQTIEIKAPIASVWEIARNVEAFPQFMSDLQSLTLQDRSPDGKRTVTEWVGMINAVKMKVRWTQEDVWDDANYSDTFKLIQGDMDRMEGTWKFLPISQNLTRFESVVDYDLNVPMVGPMVKGLIKKLMTQNLQSTLDAIKQKAESGQI